MQIPANSWTLRLLLSSQMQLHRPIRNGFTVHKLVSAFVFVIKRAEQFISMIIIWKS